MATKRLQALKGEHLKSVQLKEAAYRQFVQMENDRTKMESLLADTSALPDCEGVQLKIIQAELAIQKYDALHATLVEQHHDTALSLNTARDLSEANRRTYDSIDAKMSANYEALRLQRLQLSQEINANNEVTFATNAQREGLEIACVKNEQLKEKFEVEVRKKNVRLLVVEKELNSSIGGFNHRRSERQQKNQVLDAT